MYQVERLKHTREQLFQDFLSSDLHQGTKRIHTETLIENGAPIDDSFDREVIVISLETCQGDLIKECELYNFLPLVEFLWNYAEAKHII
jgi:hypothetical protein